MVIFLGLLWVHEGHTAPNSKVGRRNTTDELQKQVKDGGVEAPRGQPDPPTEFTGLKRITVHYLWSLCAGEVDAPHNVPAVRAAVVVLV